MLKTFNSVTIVLVKISKLKVFLAFSKRNVNGSHKIDKTIMVCYTIRFSRGTD